MSGVGQLPIAPWRVVARESWRALGRGRFALPPLAVVLVAAAGAGVVPPLVLGVLVDHLTAGSQRPDAVWLAAALLIAAVVVGAALSAVGSVLIARLFESMLARLRERMVDAMFTLPAHQVERAGSGDLIARAGDDVAEVSTAIPRVVPAVSSALFSIAVSVAGMAVVDWRYALAMVVVLPVHIFAVRAYLRTAPAAYAAERAAMSVRAQHLVDALRGIETVRAYGLQGQHSARLAGSSWSVVRSSMRALVTQNRFFARLNLAEFLGLTALLVTGFLLVREGLGSVGGATAAMLLFVRLFGPINELLFVIDDLQSAAASLGRIVGVIAARPSEPAPPASVGSEVRVSGVTVEFDPGVPVAIDVDLTIASGEVVAVVGESGAGKSTLAAVVAGLRVPTSGRVEAPSATLLVTQETHVFAGTLRDNLTLVDPDAPDSDLVDALHRVGAGQLLDTLGLDGAVDAAGAQLSAAQVQQVALARVIVADPRVVVLDEATAEAGSAEAGTLDRASSEALRGRSGLVIAHLLSQAAAADRVIVMDAGRIVEEGTHDALLASGGRYAELWRTWSGTGTVG